MLKIKFYLISVAVITGVLGAFGSRPKASCESQQQYVKFGNTYFPVGQYGVDYYCTASAGNCTYYLYDPFTPGSYAPCRTGTFTWAYK